MGQMTYAVMLGVSQAAPESAGDEGWYEITSKYKTKKGELRPDMPCGDGNHDMIGFWCAVGASGEEGIPDLDTDFLLEDFAGASKVYAEAHKRAVEAWEKFAEWADGRGITLDKPRLWLVQTEVA